jgi:hypothetical protein
LNSLVRGDQPIVRRRLPCPVFRQLTWPVDSGLVLGF